VQCGCVPVAAVSSEFHDRVSGSSNSKQLPCWRCNLLAEQVWKNMAAARHCMFRTANSLGSYRRSDVQNFFFATANRPTGEREKREPVYLFTVPVNETSLCSLMFCFCTTVSGCQTTPWTCGVAFDILRI